MRFTYLAAALLFLGVEADTAGDLKLFQQLAKNASAIEAARLAHGTGSCNRDNIVVRKPWGSMCQSERKAYTNAVKCLQKLPSKTPSSYAPGARSRYDDFVATHINQTLTIHYTAQFLGWHRLFTWQYEQALRHECGYTGTQPYWNWALYADDPASSPIFDGSDYSMGGNGKYIPNKGPITLTMGDLPAIHLPPGSGGGCVTSGPFKDMVVNLGPVYLPLNNGSVLNGTGLEYNPRCLKRDVSAGVNSAYANATSIVNLITQSQNINDFQMNMQGIPGSGNIGVHGGGHYTIGGDPAGDVFTSPGEPVFFLHHGMIDLVWWIWQNLDYEKRRNAIAGTKTFLNSPPSDNATLSDVVNLHYAGGSPTTLGNLMSNTAGSFCYTYGGF